MQHDAEIATRFLRRLYPATPWLLVAIAVDQLGIVGKWIDPNFGDPDGAVASFLRAHHDHNVYFTVNPVTRELHKKPERVDIARVAYLHVDIDPRAPEPNEPDLDAHNARERERILKLFKDPPDPIPQPTGCIFSGGGYQGFWRLEDSIQIVGDTEAERLASAEDAKRYNLQLEWAFGCADACHNIDRIMRLPGTINWPNAKKRAKGRKPARASVVWWIDDAALPLSAFTAAPLIQSTGGTIRNTKASHAKIATVAPGNLRRYTIDELATKYPGVNRRAWVVVVQGRDPDNTERHDGRSEWLFYACCEMVRGGVPDDVIYSVITDPDFGISASVLDKRGSMERYATRQIDRAKEVAIDPALAELNDRYFVVKNYGGKCRVLEEIADPVLNRSILTHQSFDDFRNSYMNRRVNVGTTKQGAPITVPLGKWWLEHEMRRQYDRVVFAPQRDVPNAYNLWQGFAVEPRPGNRHESFLRHVRQNLCDNNDDVYTYLVGWMALAVQHPDRQGEVAIVLRGARGTGKGFFAKHFGALFGRHFLQVSNGNHLVGQFNAQLRDAVVVFADEAFFAGDKKHESVLKTLITEETQVNERKHIDAEIVANYVHLILASNENWVVPAGHHERRFLALDVSEAHLQDHAYFEGMNAELEEDSRAGLSNLLYYLQTYDLRSFNVRAVPKTTGLREQKILSLDSLSEWLFRKLEEGILLPDHVGWSAPIIKDRLVDDYLVYSQRVGNRRSTATALGRFLSKVIPNLKEFQGNVEYYDKDRGRRIDRKHLYEFPPLDECRAGFEKSVIGEYPWPAVTTRGDLNFQQDPF